MGIDGSDHGTTDRLLHPDTLRALRSLRLPNLTYRLRTELAIETWHWNPEGVWSDPAHERGYFVSGVAGGGAIRRSWGYRLPRRGSTGDQANNDGYSRLADNDRATFWKSNPYLDPYFTGDPATAHPQWIVVDLGRILPVNAVRVEWRGQKLGYLPRTENRAVADAMDSGERVDARIAKLRAQGNPWQRVLVEVFVLL